MNAVAQISTVTDKLGRTFDAGKFRVDANGQPRFDSLGRFVNLRGGRNKKVVPMNPEPATKPAPSAATPPPADAPKPVGVGTDDAPDFSEIEKLLKNPAPAPGAETPTAAVEVENVTAETAIGLIQTALVLIGEEEGILSEMEKKMLRRPLDRVLDKYNIGSNALPAEVELAVVVATLVINRLQKPKTMTFFQKVKTGVANWWMRRKGASAAKTLRREVGPIGPEKAGEKA